MYFIFLIINDLKLKKVQNLCKVTWNTVMKLKFEINSVCPKLMFFLLYSLSHIYKFSLSYWVLVSINIYIS